MTKTAVVILNYNGEKFLRQFLPSVIQHSGDALIVVADNRSTDKSLSILRDEFPAVRVIELEQNYGYCGGYNRALKQVEADYFVLLNSDIEVTSGWLQPMEQLFDGNSNIQAMQPKVLSYHNKSLFEYAGAAGGFIDTLGYPFCRGRLFNHVETDNGQYNDEREVFWATGACLMIRSSSYSRFGGLDEDLFAHMEEIDLCWKINRSGGKVYYCGKSTVYHVGAGTLGHENPRKTYLNFRNGLVMIYKHFSSVELYTKIPCRIVLDWVAAVVFALTGKVGHMQAVLKAHYDFFNSLAVNRKKRSAIQDAYPDYPRTNIHPGLIIFDYYFRRKKTTTI
jgi:GT2 family glycosyltransferase